MQFCLEKTEVTLKKGLLLKSKRTTQDVKREIAELEHYKTYEYFRIN